jgi:hypothetical protein
MLYLLDANVLISAHELHYPLQRIPQFWSWLLTMAEAGTIKMPYEIYNEIAISNGELKEWITTPDHSKKLKLSAHVWSARLEMCQWRRETLDKESIWEEARSTSLSKW